MRLISSDLKRPVCFQILKLKERLNNFQILTGQHSIRMHTTRLSTISVSVAATRCQYCGRGICHEVNKFEQVSNGDHQISVAGGRASRPHVNGRGGG